TDIQFVSVCGIARMASLLRALKCRPTRGKIVSLFLSSEDGGPGGPGCTGHSAECRTMILSILDTIPPHHLRVLYIESLCYSDFPLPVVPVNFPSPTDLHISGPLRDESFTTSCTAPRLKRLHISRYIAPPACLATELQRISPQLTHLHLSPCDDMSMLHFLHAYCKFSRPHEDKWCSFMMSDLPQPTISPDAIPESLSRITISISRNHAMVGGEYVRLRSYMMLAQECQDAGLASYQIHSASSDSPEVESLCGCGRSWLASLEPKTSPRSSSLQRAAELKQEWLEHSLNFSF
ncbi:hypothetical protein EIP91_011262, partial [Steccherinum ochraceum]